eukprot:7381027-Alexandrium_andersonii.AAC.1
MGVAGGYADPENGAPDSLAGEGLSRRDRLLLDICRRRPLRWVCQVLPSYRSPRKRVLLDDS